MAVLRAAQAVGLGGRIERCHRAIAPGQPAERRLEQRAVLGACAGKDPAFALDHHRAGFGQRGRDQRDPRFRIGSRNLQHPFRPGAGLAEAAPGADQP